MVKLKSKKVAAFFGVVLLLVAASSAYIVIKKHSSSNKASSNMQSGSKEDIAKKNAELYAQNIAIIDKLRQDSVTDNIKNSQVLAMYKDLNAKDYTKVVAVASNLCKALTGNDQFYCYDFYGQALAAQNDFAAYILVGNEALQSPGVKANEVAAQSWQNNLIIAKKGQNPYVKTTDTDAEARR